MSEKLIPNGGFLAGWTSDGDTWGDSGWSKSGDAGSGIGGTSDDSRGQGAKPALKPFDMTHQGMGDTSNYQTAGGSGGGFTNFASWLYANPMLPTQEISDPASYVSRSGLNPNVRTDTDGGVR